MKKKSLTFLGLTSRALMIIAAFFLLLSYFSIMINPAKIWILSVFGLCFLPFWILNLLLLLWAIKKLSKAALIPLLALLPSIFFISRFVRFSNGDPMSQSDAEPSKVTVVSYNVGRFALSKSINGVKLSQVSCSDSIISFLNTLNADIICLQEFFINDKSNIKQFLSDKFKGYNAEYYVYSSNKGYFGNVTLSRYPVMKKGVFEFEKSTNLAIYTDLKIKDKIWRVYNCHFESYNISLSHMARRIATDRNVVIEAERKMKKSISIRPRQVEQIMKDIETCTLKALVAGDFNDTPMSYTYFRLTKGKKDSFVEAGQGFGATYSSLWPALRIDYILYPDKLKAYFHSILRLKYSDHYPVIAGINLAGD